MLDVPLTACCWLVCNLDWLVIIARKRKDNTGKIVDVMVMRHIFVDSLLLRITIHLVRTATLFFIIGCIKMSISIH